MQQHRSGLRDDTREFIGVVVLACECSLSCWRKVAMLRFLCVGLLLAFSSHAHAQEHAVVGTWKLLSQEAIVEGEAPEKVFSNGYLIVTREGRVMALFTAENRKAGMGDAERAALHKSMAAVSGKYRVESSTFVI